MRQSFQSSIIGVTVIILFAMLGAGCDAARTPVDFGEVPLLNQTAQTVSGDSVYWINDVARFTDYEQNEWELRRTINGNDIGVDIYQNGVLASSFTVTHSAGSVESFVLSAPATGDWVAIDQDGRIYDGSIAVEPGCGIMDEPGDPDDGWPIEPPGSGDDRIIPPGCNVVNGANGINLFNNDEEEESCAEEKAAAIDAIEDAAVTVGYSIIVSIVSAGVFAKPAIFASGLALTRASYRLGKYGLCLYQNRDSVAFLPTAVRLEPVFCTSVLV